jgi:rubredoxin
MEQNKAVVVVSRYVCWLCGYKLAPDSPDAQMRARRCPNCMLDSAFVPVESITR